MRRVNILSFLYHLSSQFAPSQSKNPVLPSITPTWENDKLLHVNRIQTMQKNSLASFPSPSRLPPRKFLSASSGNWYALGLPQSTPHIPAVASPPFR